MPTFNVFIQHDIVLNLLQSLNILITVFTALFKVTVYYLINLVYSPWQLCDKDLKLQLIQRILKSSNIL